MKQTPVRVYCLLSSLALALVMACTSPTQPRVSSSTPLLNNPADGSVVAFAAQPHTLVIGNAVSTTTEEPTYTFEVAADAEFSEIVFSRSGVQQGGDGQTSVTIDRLPHSTTYFWRAQIENGGELGPAPKLTSFSIGPEVVLEAPVLATPAQDGSGTDTPTLTVNNAQRTGPAGEVFYRFEISEQADFSSLVYEATVPEQAGSASTSHSVTKQLEEKNYFWRAQATSPSSAATSPFSTANLFKVSKGVDLATATIVIGPQNIADWPERSQITDAYVTSNGLCIYHSHLGLWPPAPFGDTTTEGNQWVFALINGQWIGGAADYYRPRQACKALDAQSIGRDAFYQTPNSPVYSWQPVSGEVFAVMVSTPARAWPTYKTWDERSNVVLIKWP